MNCRYKIQQLGSQKLIKKNTKKSWNNSNSVVSYYQNQKSKWDQRNQIKWPRVIIETVVIEVFIDEMLL